MYQIYVAGGTENSDSGTNTKLIIGLVGSILIIGVAVFISKKARKTAKKLQAEEEAAEKLKLLEAEEEMPLQHNSNTNFESIN